MNQENDYDPDTENPTFDPESSDVRHNNEFYTNNLYNYSDSFVPQDSLKENLINKSKQKEGNISKVKENKPVLEKKFEEDNFSEDSDNESHENEQNMDFNLKTTIAHLQSDLIYSIGVFISAVIINMFPDMLYFDSICTILFSYVALELTIPIYKESVRILLEGAAEGILLT